MARGLAIEKDRAVQVSGRALTRDTIPESVVAQWDAKTLSLNNGDRITSWEDPINSYDAENGTSLTYISDGLNGYPVAYSDGVGDYLGIDEWPDQYSQPFAVSGVVQLQSLISDYQQVIGWGDSEGKISANIRPENGSGYKEIWNGTGLTADSATTSTFAYVAVFDGSNSVFRINDSEYAGDVGGRIIDAGAPFRIGADKNENHLADCYHAEHVLHGDYLDSESRDNEITRLNKKWL